MKYFIILTSMCCVYVSGKIPSYIKICSKNEHLKQCLTDNYQAVLEKNGDPSLKLQSLSRIRVENLSLHAAKDLNITFKNTDFFGIERTKLSDISIDDKELQLTLQIPHLEIIGDYELNGKLLFLPLEGAGNLNLTFVDLIINYKAKLRNEKREEKSYFYVDNNYDDTQLTAENVNRVYFKLDNLFGGDPKLGPEMNIFLNENWKDVYGAIQPAIIHISTFVVINPVVNAYLGHIPIDSLFS